MTASKRRPADLGRFQVENLWDSGAFVYARARVRALLGASQNRVRALLGARRNHDRPPRSCQCIREPPASKPLATGARRVESLQAGVAEWQTRRTQNPLVARPCGFDSLLRHTFSSFGMMYAGTSEARGRASLRAKAYDCTPRCLSDGVYGSGTNAVQRNNQMVDIHIVP